MTEAIIIMILTQAKINEETAFSAVLSIELFSSDSQVLQAIASSWPFSFAKYSESMILYVLHM